MSPLRVQEALSVEGSNSIITEREGSNFFSSHTNIVPVNVLVDHVLSKPLLPTGERIVFGETKAANSNR